MNKFVRDMTRAELEAVPYRPSWDAETYCRTAIIIPARPRTLMERLRAVLGRANDNKDRYLHDSGFRCMTLVAVDQEQYPICQTGACSDAIHIEGIGGFGHHWFQKGTGIPESLPPNEWSIDCLPRSGLLQLMSHTGYIIVGHGMSSMEVYSSDVPEEMVALENL